MKLIVITDWSVSDCLERAIAAARVSSEVAIQHRNHGVPREQFMKQARQLRDACPKLFINSDAELARELGAGLHLPEHLELEFSGPVTKAIHEHSRAALVAGRTYLLSPVFPPLSKASISPVMGTHRFHQIAAALPGPVFALGGLNAARITSMKPLSGAAVIGAVMHARDPVRATEELLRALE